MQGQSLSVCWPTNYHPVNLEDTPQSHCRVPTVALWPPLCRVNTQKLSVPAVAEPTTSDSTKRLHAAILCIFQLLLNHWDVKRSLHRLLSHPLVRCVAVIESQLSLVNRDVLEGGPRRNCHAARYWKIITEGVWVRPSGQCKAWLLLDRFILPVCGWLWRCVCRMYWWWELRFCGLLEARYKVSDLGWCCGLV